jgi:hypothetical protein
MHSDRNKSLWSSKKQELDSLYLKNDQLKRLVRCGIPDDMRGRLWQLWSGAKFKITLWEGHYSSLLQYYHGQPSIATSEIEKVAT